jgi:hypothetical protein
MSPATMRFRIIFAMETHVFPLYCGPVYVSVSGMNVERIAMQTKQYVLFNIVAKAKSFRIACTVVPP